ncbi:MAG: rhomboid family intramembrane serine protease, partial [Mesorhizobium sp.]
MSEPASPSQIEQGEGGPVGREPEPRREPVFNMPPVVLALIGICVVVHLIRLYWLTDDQDFSLLIRTAFIPIRYSGRFDLDFYAFSSPFTYAFLHGGFAHLA